MDIHSISPDRILVRVSSTQLLLVSLLTKRVVATHTIAANSVFIRVRNAKQKHFLYVSGGSVNFFTISKQDTFVKFSKVYWYNEIDITGQRHYKNFDVRELTSIDKERYLIKFFSGRFSYEIMYRGPELTSLGTPHPDRDAYFFKHASCLEGLQNFKRFSYMGRTNPNIFLGVKRHPNLHICLVNIDKNECYKVLDLSPRSDIACLHLIAHKDKSSDSMVKITAMIEADSEEATASTPATSTAGPQVATALA